MCNKQVTKCVFDALRILFVSLDIAVEGSVGWRRVERDLSILMLAIATHDLLGAVSTMVFLIADIVHGNHRGS
jgi:hypothetical protein